MVEIHGPSFMLGLITAIVGVFIYLWFHIKIIKDFKIVPVRNRKNANKNSK